MKIFVYVRPRDWTTAETFYRLYNIFVSSGLEYAVNEEYAAHIKKLTGVVVPGYTRVTPEDVERGAMMISFGGDGTLLYAMRSLRGLPVPVAGVNAGRMGFLAGIPPLDFGIALENIKNGNYIVDKLSMLSVEGDFPTAPDFPHALNEFTLHRHTGDMIEVEMYVDGSLLAVVRADGTIVSTPTGSTAYSMSAGGPILAPGCSCFVALSIAPHNFSIRPLVVPDTSTVELKVRTRGNEVLASLDNASCLVGDGARFTIKKSDYHTFLVRTQNISFYDTLRDRTMWGVDTRDTPHKTFGFK